MFPFETHVIVVEDSEVMGNMLVKELAGIGFKNLHLVLKSTEALIKINEVAAGRDAAAAGSPDVPRLLIVADWNMPQVSGLDILKTLRKDESLSFVPFLMVTTDSEKQRVVEAIRAGANGYLVKPFSRDQFRVTLANIWKRLEGRPLQKAA